jgi:hypothetical protein
MEMVECILKENGRAILLRVDDISYVVELNVGCRITMRDGVSCDVKDDIATVRDQIRRIYTNRG